MINSFFIDEYIICRYPRLYHLSDKTVPTSYDNDETQWNGLQIRLNVTESRVFGTQFNWDISSNNPTDNEYHNGVDFWVINETQLTGKPIESLFCSFKHNCLLKKRFYST